MAKSISVNSGSLLIGNPIGVSVESEYVGGNVAFHKVKLVVRAALSTDIDFEEFVLSAPAGSNEVVEFDISDQLRTVAGKFQYQPISGDYTYPYLIYNLSAYDEYMSDGILHEKVGERIYQNTLNALMGAFTDAERLYAGNTKVLTAYTRKPSEGEVCSQQETLVYPESYGFELGMLSTLTSGPKVVALPLAGKTGFLRAGNRNIYVDANSENRIMFQFVNGLGIVESISAETLESLSTQGDITMNTVTAPSAFGRVNRIYAKKSGRRPVIHCSTGLISREWAYWWSDEFFGSDNFRISLPASCWVKLGGIWYPCVAYLDDDSNIYDNADPKGVKLDFTVEFGINGMPYPRL